MSTRAPELADVPAEPDDAPVRSGPVKRGRIVLMVGIAIVVVSLAANGWLAWRLHDATASTRERARVASISRSFLFALTNFQASTIEHDVARIRGYAVGDFAQQVRTFFDANAIQTLKRAQAKSTGRVQSVFVETLNGGTASAFGLVNETVTNVSQPTARADVLRIEIQLIDSSGGWKVSRVDILQSPSGSPLGG